MEENISEKSGFVRLALGTGLTALGVSHLAKENGNKTLGFSLIVCGAMKVAEGIFLYCPTKAMINSNVKDAMTSTIEDFMDGDTIMSGFRDLYKNVNSSNTGNSNNANTSGSNLAQTVANVAKTVSEATPSGTAVNTAAQAANQTLKNTSNPSNNTH